MRPLRMFRRKPKGERRDPAPSRMAYKLNRLMLRPMVRRFLRFGLPVLLIAAGVAFWASDQSRRDAAMDRVAEIRRQIEERPEFMVRLMAVEDASTKVAGDIREVLSIDFPFRRLIWTWTDCRKRSRNWMPWQLPACASVQAACLRSKSKSGSRP